MRGAARAAVALALGLLLVGLPTVARADPPGRERIACTDVHLVVGQRIPGEALAQCLRSRMTYATSFTTRIAATGDRSTTALVKLDPTVVRATRGSEHARVTAHPRPDEPLFATFVRVAAPPDQLVAVARSVAAWTVVRTVNVLDADDALRPAYRLVPAEAARFDGAVASRVSLHLDAGYLPVRFRATTTTASFAVVYTQRWSEWGARLLAVCSDPCSATVDPVTGRVTEEHSFAG